MANLSRLNKSCQAQAPGAGGEDELNLSLVGYFQQKYLEELVSCGCTTNCVYIQVLMQQEGPLCTQPNPNVEKAVMHGQVLLQHQLTQPIYEDMMQHVVMDI